MSNSNFYFITAIGVVAAVASFCIGKSQSQIVYVQTEHVVYKPYTQAEEQKRHQQFLRQEQRQYLQDAHVINQALLAWAKDHDWGKDHVGHYRYGVLPSQGELVGGCLNNYESKHLAQSYAQQGILVLTSSDRTAIAYRRGTQPDAPSGIPSHFVVAQMQDKAKEVTVRLYGDGHVISG